MGNVKGSAKLNPKQRMFVEEYIKDLNGKQAAIRAGYAAMTAENCACQLMTRPHIKAAIQWAMDGRSQRLRIESDSVLEEIATIAFYDIADIAKAGIVRPEQIADLPLNVRKCIAGWSWDKHGHLVLKLVSKETYHKLLCAHLKICNPTVEFKLPKQTEAMKPDEAMDYLRKQLEADNATNGA